jgi:sugar-phosphatase
VLAAVIFDLDGVLIDSEPLWQEAEREVFDQVGLHLTVADMVTTMGLRVDEVVAHWYARRPWPGADPAGFPALAHRLMDRVEELMLTTGQALPGGAEAVAACTGRGLPRALASSSLPRVIAAALERLGLADAFPVVCSAADEAYGKPHPAVFLTAAARLGVDPTACLVVEDSVNGMVAAKAARMRCVVVPERTAGLADDPRLALADHVLPSLEAFPALLGELMGELVEEHDPA